jgi:mono/diheme cytochrome c family protein
MDASPNRTLLKILFGAGLGLIVLAIILAANGNIAWGEWKVPEAAKLRVNPVLPGPAALDSARTIYKDRCAHCHGDTGKGDGPDAHKHSTQPTNFTDQTVMTAQTDGALFYKITEGRRPMPGFGKRLSEEQRWQLVLLLREFSRPAN